MAKTGRKSTLTSPRQFIRDMEMLLEDMNSGKTSTVLCPLHKDAVRKFAFLARCIIRKHFSKGAS